MTTTKELLEKLVALPPVRDALDSLASLAHPDLQPGDHYDVCTSGGYGAPATIRIIGPQLKVSVVLDLQGDER